MRKYLYIAAGGAAGAVLRYLVKLIPIMDQSVFPVNTLITNITGCFVLMLFTVLSLRRIRISEEAKLAITVGLLGGFTTFSTFCRETADLVWSGSSALGIVYFILTPVLCLGAGLLGSAFANSIMNKLSSGSENDGSEV